MNIEKAKQEFIKYADEFNMSDIRIARKKEHSFRVMKEAEELAINLELPPEEVEIAKLIGLLHDIGRLKQLTIYDTYEDYQSIDHGDLAVEILTKDNYLRNFIEETEYDNIILKAIKNHNKFKIEDGLTEKELFFAKLIRDADKLDIFYEGVEMFWEAEEERQKVMKSEVSQGVIEQFNKKETIKRENVKNSADDVIGFIAFIFDINFEYSKNKIKKEKYIEKLLEKFKGKDFGINLNFLVE